MRDWTEVEVGDSGVIEWCLPLMLLMTFRRIEPGGFEASSRVNSERSRTASVLKRNQQ